MNQTVAAIVEAHRAGATTPAQTVAETFARIRAHGDPAIFISLREEADAIAEAAALGADARDRTLFGVPVAIKDNIDVAGLSTTAGCPAFSYRPAQDSTVVARLRQAGAIVVGKTNLDQFATGLVGVRSPYGVPRNPFGNDLIPGGSSSGSAVAVAAGLVPLALGTDTAGSGRVPASLNNLVGLKPSLGLISTAGVVPACRTIDCVSILALTVDDAWTALAAIAGPDPRDPYSRTLSLGAPGAWPKPVRLGVPAASQREFFGDREAAMVYDEAITRCAALGGTIVKFDIAPFMACARLLYDGPWVAERYLVARELIEAKPDVLFPVTREIISQGAKPSAAQAFEAFYKLEEFRRARDQTFETIDVMLLPTIPTAYSIQQVLADPIALNNRLGTYTNFVNLLELCALAVPAAIRSDGAPSGVTFIAPAGQDALLASLGRAFHADIKLPLGTADR